MLATAKGYAKVKKILRNLFGEIFKASEKVIDGEISYKTRIKEKFSCCRIWW